MGHVRDLDHAWQCPCTLAKATPQLHHPCTSRGRFLVCFYDTDKATLSELSVNKGNVFSLQIRQTRALPDNAQNLGASLIKSVKAKNTHHICSHDEWIIIYNDQKFTLTPSLVNLARTKTYSSYVTSTIHSRVRTTPSVILQLLQLRSTWLYTTICSQTWSKRIRVVGHTVDLPALEGFDSYK